MNELFKFKLLVLTYKALYGLSLSYLQDQITLTMFGEAAGYPPFLEGVCVKERVKGAESMTFHNLTE